MCVCSVVACRVNHFTQQTLSLDDTRYNAYLGHNVVTGRHKYAHSTQLNSTANHGRTCQAPQSPDQYYLTAIKHYPSSVEPY